MHLTGREVLGVDAGTQGVSVILWSPERRHILAVGESAYAHNYIPGRPEGRLEQYAHYWSDALEKAMANLRQALPVPLEKVAAIGVTAHMHCMVRKNATGEKPWGCDMWNDPRGVPESRELTGAFGEHIPARWTACHILSAMRDSEAKWEEVTGVNVASGSIVHELTGEWVVGPGDASGMFGNLGEDGQIDREKCRKMDALAGNRFRPLEEAVPRVAPAGQVAGRLTEAGSALLGGLPAGTPVAAPEGDQQSVLVGAGAGELELALSAGTSFTGNLPCTAKVMAENESMNVLSTPDGRTMLMVCVRNGTVGFANYVKSLAELSGTGFAETADRLTDLAAALPVEAFGTTLLGFFQGENAVELPHARAQILDAGLEILANPGVMARLLLESPCMVMRYGLNQVQPKVGKVRRIILSGGVLKSKDGYAPQLFADILGIPVVARVGDEEGTAKGAAVLAAFMAAREAGREVAFDVFVREACGGEEKVWQPDTARSAAFKARYATFEAGLQQMRASG